MRALFPPCIASVPLRVEGREELSREHLSGPRERTVQDPSRGKGNTECSYGSPPLSLSKVAGEKYWLPLYSPLPTLISLILSLISVISYHAVLCLLLLLYWFFFFTFYYLSISFAHFRISLGAFLEHIMSIILTSKIIKFNSGEFALRPAYTQSVADDSIFWRGIWWDGSRRIKCLTADTNSSSMPCANIYMISH